MFKIRAILLVFTLIATATGVGIFHISERDRETYQALLESSDPSRKENQLLPYSQQMREGVSKQIWYQDQSPLNIRINSEGSKLLVFEREKEYEVIEHLEHANCLMQEELFYRNHQPMQRVRYLEAEKAFYNYQSQELVANDAKIWQYELQGHEPVETLLGQAAIMEGIARHIETSLDHLQAFEMEAQFNHQNELFSVKADQADYDQKKITLIGNVSIENEMGRVSALQAVLHKDEEKKTNLAFPWAKLTSNVKLFLSNGGTLSCDSLWCDYIEKKSTFIGNVVYSDTMGEVYSERAQVDYVEIDGTLKAKQITLMEHVRLFNHEGKYALADFVIYDPDQQLMILEGRENRVLFYDKIRDFKLSAPTVRAQRNLQTGKDSIQGVGDVRFIFGSEETEKFKEHFGQPYFKS